MKPDFDKAVAVVLAHEGGRFTDDPADPGGATKWGISLRLARKEHGPLDFDLDDDGDVDADDIEALTQENAIGAYRTLFWDRYGYGDLHDHELAAKVFDLAVNMGPRQAHLCLQRAVRAHGIHLVEDGVLGPVTRSAAAECQHLVLSLRSEAAGFYRELVARRPPLARFLKGWLNRAYD